MALQPEVLLYQKNKLTRQQYLVVSARIAYMGGWVNARIKTS
jgi:hypothetical protein